MFDHYVLAGLLLFNAAAVAACAWLTARADHHRRCAKGSANVACRARADAAGYAHEAKQAADEATRPDVLPLPPGDYGASWYDGKNPEMFR